MGLIHIFGLMQNVYNYNDNLKIQLHLNYIKFTIKDKCSSSGSCNDYNIVHK